jgi:hypothetical protein
MPHKMNLHLVLTDDSYNVGQHMIAANLIQGCQMGKTGRLDLAAVRSG